MGTPPGFFKICEFREEGLSTSDFTLKLHKHEFQAPYITQFQLFFCAINCSKLLEKSSYCKSCFSRIFRQKSVFDSDKSSFSILLLGAQT